MCWRCVEREEGNRCDCFFPNLLSEVHEMVPEIAEGGNPGARSGQPCLGPPTALTLDSRALNTGGGDLSRMAASGQWKVRREETLGARHVCSAECGRAGRSSAGRGGSTGRPGQGTGLRWQITRQLLRPPVGQHNMWRL